MGYAADAFVFLVSLVHGANFVLCVFLWQSAAGRRVVGSSEAFAKTTAGVAALFGLSQLAIGVGLLWGLFEPKPTMALHLKMFFLIWGALVGLLGGFLINRLIYLLQALPAFIAVFLLWLRV